MTKAEDYLVLFANCIPVKGARKSTIIDLGRRDYYEIGNDYVELLEELEKKPAHEVFTGFSPSEMKDSIVPFADFLISNELGHFTSEKGKFPKITFGWDHHSPIKNAIIDISNKSHNLSKVFTELDELGTEHLQIRFYRIASLEEIENIAKLASTFEFYSVEIIAQFDQEVSQGLDKILNENPILTLFTFTSSPELKFENKYANPDVDTTVITSKVIHTTQEVNSCEACGIINLRSMTIPHMKDYAEMQHFNGCLNRKISIDVEGEIRNCPSMKKSFGNHENVSLIDALKQEEFKEKWSITKNQIDICKECEYRYICTDCRAYTADANDPLSKPLKCSYDPFTGVWNSTPQEEKVGVPANKFD